MLLRCELLSLFRGLYDFIQRSYWRKRRLFPAKEARWASHLLNLCSCDLRREWSESVTASDASLSGLGVCRREMPVDSVRAIGAQKETLAIWLQNLSCSSWSTEVWTRSFFRSFVSQTIRCYAWWPFWIEWTISRHWSISHGRTTLERSICHSDEISWAYNVPWRPWCHCSIAP